MHTLFYPSILLVSYNTCCKATNKDICRVNLPIFCQKKSLKQLKQFYDAQVVAPYFSIEDPEQTLKYVHNQESTQTQFNNLF
jgi:hypothetical protein